MDVFEAIKETHPLFYVVFSVMGVGVGALSLVIKMLWKSLDERQKKVDSLHESKEQIVLSSTEALKEMISLNQLTHDNVMKIYEGRSEDKLSEEQIKNSLKSIQETLGRMEAQIKK